MPEMTNAVSPILISYLCDKCGEGGLVATGVTHSEWPAKYEHICDYCNGKALLNECYPRIDYDLTN